jgi:hypothetical protein
MGDYGLGGVTASVAGTGDNLTANTAQAFTFSPPVAKATVSNHPDSPATIKVRWNGTASATAWDEVLEPGQSVDSKDGFYVASVSLFPDQNATNNTHFSVRGWA